MNSSPEPLPLAQAPVGVRLRPENPGALDGFLAEQLERERKLAFEAGYAQASGELSDLITRLAKDLEEDANRNLDQLAEASARIGIRVARELLKLELVAQGHDVEAMVRASLSQLRSGRDACEVRLHPEDLERVERASFGATVSFCEDQSVRRGDVIVISPQGRLVRSLDDSLDAIGEALHAELQP